MPAESGPPLSILIFFVLEENGGALSSPASCKQPLGSSVLLLGGATAYKSPSEEALKIRFALGGCGIYCFNICIPPIHTHNSALSHRFLPEVEEADVSLPAPPAGPYLQVRGSLKGLVADGADVAAVLPVGLSAVPPQRVGVLAHLVAVVALVTAPR